MSAWLLTAQIAVCDEDSLRSHSFAVDMLLMQSVSTNLGAHRNFFPESVHRAPVCYVMLGVAGSDAGRGFAAEGVRPPFNVSRMRLLTDRREQAHCKIHCSMRYIQGARLAIPGRIGWGHRIFLFAI